jgi:hypothetical protein
MTRFSLADPDADSGIIAAIEQLLPKVTPETAATVTPRIFRERLVINFSPDFTRCNNSQAF